MNEQLLRMVQGEKQQHGAFDERLRSAHAHHCHLRATAPERRGSHLPASFRPHTPAARAMSWSHDLVRSSRSSRVSPAAHIA